MGLFSSTSVGGTAGMKTQQQADPGRSTFGARSHITGTTSPYLFLSLPISKSVQQAFEGLKNAGRKVRRPDCTLATTDHVCED
jgi:homoaconitase/3-isopropylmalate dehydratase large subunit